MWPDESMRMSAPPGGSEDVPGRFTALMNGIDDILTRGRIAVPVATVAWPFVFVLAMFPISYALDGFGGGFDVRMVLLLATMLLGYAIVPLVGGTIALVGGRARRHRYRREARIRLESVDAWHAAGKLPETHHATLRTHFEDYRDGRFPAERALRASTAVLATALLTVPPFFIVAFGTVIMLVDGGDIGYFIPVLAATVVGLFFCVGGFLVGVPLRKRAIELRHEQGDRLESFEDEVLRAARDGRDAPTAASTPAVSTANRPTS